MAGYALREDLSFCRVGERLVFLDIGTDRYFQLPCPTEDALTKYLEGTTVPGPDLRALVEHRILVDEVQPVANERLRLDPATRSSVEAPAPPRSVRIAELVEVLAIVAATRLALKVSTLKRILDRLAAGRRGRTNAGPHPGPVEQRLTDAASAFRRARLYVPIDMRCLLDSIAMAKFLQRRGLASHVVFGVALDPFTAHCWVQADDLVLNDTLGNVAAHTPIRVV